MKGQQKWRPSSPENVQEEGKKKKQSPSDEPFLSETAGGSRLSLLQIYTQDVLCNVPSSESNHQRSKSDSAFWKRSSSK